ncbi:DUF983 domain-containing protein [Albibacterium sp.]|uniref:DUF983 domain-containing protein n=1 Tax=Albibacterium sp. TaxID=2952885 RepID=UPI002CF00C82|nr:DUF983 domain-containing protein [Albibacterium sp.]HUH19608.1 hypothetical protein [Albibacterium sp.]
MENKEEVGQWYALVHAKCARCRKGRMFEPGVFKQKMFIRCEYCDLFYERHPGYFYVAMYVSYALNVAEVIALAIATFVLSGGSENVWLYLAVILTFTILLAPFNFCYSRVLHMHFLDPGLKYQPDIAEQAHQIKNEKSVLR